MDVINSVEQIKLENDIVKYRISTSLHQEIIGELVLVIGEKENLQHHPNHPDLFQIHDFFYQLEKKSLACPSCNLGFILNIDVLEVHRRKGIGRALIDQAEEVSLENSVCHFIALVIKNDDNAKGFWNSMCNSNNWQKTPYILSMMNLYEKKVK